MAVAPLPTIVLGSQSPRRRELLGRLVGADRIRIVPPKLPAEPGFDHVRSIADVDAQLRHIARMKFDDVCAQPAAAVLPSCVVTADTVILAEDDARRPVVLGKPPDDDAALRAVLRQWFTRYYAGRRHQAKTCVCVGSPGSSPRDVVVTTGVWFRADAADYVDWYAATGEPRGKAGGYAIQEAGSLFVERIEGSLSNIVGLPLVETHALLRASGAL